MRILHDSPDLLVLFEPRAASQWLGGVCVALAAVVAAVALARGDSGVALGFAGLLLPAGAVLGAMATLTTHRLDRARGTLAIEVSRRGRIVERTTYPLPLVTDLVVEEIAHPTLGEPHQPAYRLAYVLSDGRRVPWSRNLVGQPNAQLAGRDAVRRFLSEAPESRRSA